MSVDCAAPVNEGKEKKTLKEFCEELQYKLEDYWIDISYKLDEAREEYEIVDEAGNSVEDRVDWGDFDASPFIEVSYRGKLLAPEERAVEDFRESVKSQNRWVNRFWIDIQNKDEPLPRRNGKEDVFSKSFGHQLSFIIFSAKGLEQKEKEALQKINSIEGLSEEKKRTLVQEINDLSLSAQKFIEQGEE